MSKGEGGEGGRHSLILHKRLSTNSGHYLSIVKVGDIGFECYDVMITKIELIISVTLILFICYFTKEVHDGNIFKGH